MSYKVAGVVVLYNPNFEVIDNIRSYIDNVDILYAIDNSDICNSEITEFLELHNKIVYISNEGNLGIAKALNIGISMAIKEKYAWVLTMDQDSKASLDMLKRMFEFIADEDTNRVGIISPYHANKYKPTSGNKKKYDFVSTVMTSGNLVNLRVIKDVGLFREDFFIDYVDHEFCLRLLKSGYRVVLINDAVLLHNLGMPKCFNLLGYKMIISNHSSIRRYYITRNRIQVWKEYCSFSIKWVARDIIAFVGGTVKIIIFEKDRINKLTSICRGIKDAFCQRYGKYQP